MKKVLCPGAERIRASFPDEVSCACGRKLELWPDEEEVRCSSCGRTVSREMPPACIEWCAAAGECVGRELYARYLRAREERAGKKEVGS